jgi:hypothetical protein
MKSEVRSPKSEGSPRSEVGRAGSKTCNLVSEYPERAVQSIAFLVAGSLLSPHPGPLPWGEGATSIPSRPPRAIQSFKGGLRFSLSLRERAGVRGNRVLMGQEQFKSCN